jgi:predicted homoserine dehydrogenase-like protein
MMLSAYDQALVAREAEGRPVRVGLFGAGNFARMVAGQLSNPAPPGVRLAAVVNRTPARAAAMLDGLEVGWRAVASPAEFAAARSRGLVAVTAEIELVAASGEVDLILEATGTVEYGSGVVREAIEHRKPVVLANAELDSTLGPILAAQARRAGLVYTNIDGDEPGVAMNLIRYARSLGLRPVAAGNLKGMIDRYRNPETQRVFAEQHGQNPRIVTSFADGTKLAMEAAILANATGFRVGQPGMFGPPCGHVSEIAGLLPPDLMLSGGLVDYALGAAPHTGAFVVVHEDRPDRRRWLKYLKMGDGPFYVLYTPFHLPHIQVVGSIGRAMLGDETVAPAGPAVCQVLATAKADLPAGTVLDGPGGFTCYGRIENVADRPRGQALPIGLSTGAWLTRPVRRDEVVPVADVALPADQGAFGVWLAGGPGPDRAGEPGPA